eukprot:3631285-Rhodomonas_salina.1
MGSAMARVSPKRSGAWKVGPESDSRRRDQEFPVQLAYAMTVHKSQGQTMDFVGIDCSVRFFAHCQTYVAALHVKTHDSIAFYHHGSSNACVMS